MDWIKKALYTKLKGGENLGNLSPNPSSSSTVPHQRAPLFPSTPEEKIKRQARLRKLLEKHSALVLDNPEISLSPYQPNVPNKKNGSGAEINPWKPLIHKKFLQKLILESKQINRSNSSSLESSSSLFRTKEALQTKSEKIKVFVCFAWVLGRSDLATEHSELEQLRDLLKEAAKDPIESASIFAELSKNEHDGPSIPSDGIDINLNNMILETEEAIRFVYQMYHEYVPLICTLSLSLSLESLSLSLSVS